MAKMTWKEMQKEYNAEFVAGQLIGFANGKHVELGHMTDGEFFYSEAGAELADSADKAPDKAADKGKGAPK